MSTHNQPSKAKRLSQTLPIFSPHRDGFQEIPSSSSPANAQQFSMSRPEERSMENIPLQQVVSHGHTLDRTGSSTTARDEYAGDYKPEVQQEKSGLFHRHTRGRRKLKKVSSKGAGTGVKGYDGEEDTITAMGRFYTKFMNFSIVTRYFVYVAPVGLAIAVPIVVGATAAKHAEIGGVKIVWFFTWVEIVWLGLWIGKIAAHFLPSLFQFFAGVVSSGTRKYSLILKALNMPISFFLWALVALTTFIPVMTRNPSTLDEIAALKNTKNPWQRPHWEDIVQQVLAACLIATIVFLVEKLLIQLISISYHRKQFNSKIIDSKRNVYLICQLFDASRALFPMYCQEFQDEDYTITDSLNLAIEGGISTVQGHKRSGSATPIRVLQKVGRYGDKVAGVFGHVAHEITGKDVLNPEAAHSIVVEALDRRRSAEALAKRLWMSFVVEGREALYPEDIQEVLGMSKRDEADECFSAIDRDGNGDISLDEMILTITEIGRERKSVANSMHDVDQAIKVLDNLLSIVVLIISVLIFVAFLNTSFVTTLATTGTALLSLSFVFAGTCQEVLGSCIFIFVKHPFDIGDRVDITDTQLTVEHISLLFTVFKQVADGKMVQIPNIVLNTLWIDNVTRSKAMRERLSINVDFGTSFEDVQALRSEMQSFVLDKDNSRDFQPEIEVEVINVNNLDKLTLQIEIRHKSNWANETIRAARRSKFLCALVLALRKVPIYSPAGGDAGLGTLSAPSYSVAISEATAQAEKDKFAAAKEAKRLNPSKPAAAPKSDGQFAPHETKAMDAINSRAPGEDFSRDATFAERDIHQSADSSQTLSSSPDRLAGIQDSLEETRQILRRESTRGKRAAGASLAPSGSGISQPYGGPPAVDPRLASLEESRTSPGYAGPLSGSAPAYSAYNVVPTQSPAGQQQPPSGMQARNGNVQGSPPKGPVYKPSGGPGSNGPPYGGV